MLGINSLILTFLATFILLVNCQINYNENGAFLNKYDPNSISHNEKFLQLIVKYASLTSNRLHSLRQKYFEEQLKNLRETQKLYESSYLEPRLIEAFLMKQYNEKFITTTTSPTSSTTATETNSPLSTDTSDVVEELLG